MWRKTFSLKKNHWHAKACLDLMVTPHDILSWTLLFITGSTACSLPLWTSTALNLQNRSDPERRWAGWTECVWADVCTCESEQGRQWEGRMCTVARRNNLPICLYTHLHSCGLHGDSAEFSLHQPQWHTHTTPLACTNPAFKALFSAPTRVQDAAKPPALSFPPSLNFTHSLPSFSDKQDHCGGQSAHLDFLLVYSRCRALESDY